MLVDDILERNRDWVHGRKPQPLPPVVTLRLAVVGCYDPRLDRLLLPALGLQPGDAFLLRSAGALLLPGSTTLRSLALAIYMFGVTEVLIVGHAACRMATFDTAAFIEEFRQRGVPRDAFGEDSLRTWAGAIASPRQGVLQSVATVREAPFVPRDVRVSGVVLDETTGALEVVARPDDAVPPSAAVSSIPASATGGTSAQASADEGARARHAAAIEGAASRAAASHAAPRHAAESRAAPTQPPKSSRTSPARSPSSPSPSRRAAASKAATPRAADRAAETRSTKAQRTAGTVPPPPSTAPGVTTAPAAGNPRVAQTRALLAAADDFLATIESKEHWKADVENLRSELERRRDARQRLELLDAFARRLGAESREVAESFARLRREITAAGADPAAELLSVFHHLGRRR